MQLARGSGLVRGTACAGCLRRRLAAAELIKGSCCKRGSIDGLKFWYKLDENGVSNLSKLKFDKNKNEPDKVEFDYAAANVELHRAEIYYIDQVRKFDGTARNLELKISPDRDKFFRLISNAENCSFTIDEKETNDIGFKLNALANETGAKVESL